MKKILGFISFLLILCSPYFSSAQKVTQAYPSYQSVVVKFLEAYSIAGVPATSQFNFQKRPDGWHICVTDYSGENPVITEDFLYWNKSTGAYAEADFHKIVSASENSETIEVFLRSWDAPNFDISPYYGYEGWDKDVIGLLENSASISDTLLYALGRAYSSYAGNLLHSNSGFPNTADRFILEETRNCMSADQLAKYRKNRHLAIKKFRELALRNPSFETIVGSIGIKAANEYMTSYLDLFIYQNEEEAMKELADDLYNDFMLASARNYLLSCPENAILFTNGDNDTYPLLYLQAKKGFRQDVMVVNLSLLQTGRYINALRDPVNKAGALPLSFTSAHFSGNKRDVIVITSEQENMDLIEMIQFVKDDSHVITYGPATYYYIPTGSLLFTAGGENKMEFSIKNSYFLLNQLVFYDVLAVNNFKRPLCFAISVGEDYFFGMNDYLRLNGMVYLLESQKHNNSDYGLGSVHTSLMFEFMTKKFDRTAPVNPGSSEKLNGMNYRNIHYRLAEALIKESKPAEAEQILDAGISFLPDSVLYYDMYLIPYIDYYYQLGKFDKGNRIAEIVIYNLKKGLLNDYMPGRASNPDITYILSYIGEMAGKYEQKEIIELCK
jgi:hypothetical protein